MWRKSTDEKFFRAFTDLAERAERAAQLLVELSEQPATIADRAKQIKALEHEGDDIVKSTMHALRSTWITPFDRSDIHDTISRLDDVLDVIHAISARYDLFQMTETPPYALDFARIIHKSCGKMREAVALLNNMKRSEEMLKHVEQIDQLESEGDQLFRLAIAKLYNEGGDPLTVMKRREMYDKLESVLDLVADVGDTIEGVVLEYA